MKDAELMPIERVLNDLDRRRIEKDYENPLSGSDEIDRQ
jgi:hypothetical protein